MTSEPNHKPPTGPDKAASADNATHAPTPTRQPPTCLNSDALLQGQGSVAITHHGVMYKLQATRQGKLILTK